MVNLLRYRQTMFVNELLLLRGITGPTPENTKVEEDGRMDSDKME